MSQTQVDMVNSIALTGDFGIIKASGPFEYVSEGMSWEVSIPLEKNDYGFPGDGPLMSLKQEPEAYAVCIVDGEPHLGGKVESYLEPEGEGKLLISVDQYPMG